MVGDRWAQRGERARLHLEPGLVRVVTDSVAARGGQLDEALSAGGAVAAQAVEVRDAAADREERRCRGLGTRQS